MSIMLKVRINLIPLYAVALVAAVAATHRDRTPRWGRSARNAHGIHPAWSAPAPIGPEADQTPPPAAVRRPAEAVPR